MVSRAVCATHWPPSPDATGNTLWYVICAPAWGAVTDLRPLLFQAIKLLGAAYLIWLGAGRVWKSRHAEKDAHWPKTDGKP